VSPLNEEALRSFTNAIFRIPCYSAAHDDARLTQDSRIVYYAEGYHALRVFPILTEASAQLIKDAYREHVEEMIKKDGLEIVKQLPVSLEEMSNKTVREINPAPVWLLNKIHETHGMIGGYALKAMRYATDTVTRFPAVSMTYTRDNSPNIEVYLIGTVLSAAHDQTLRHIQMEEAKKMAAAQGSVVEVPKIVLP
jgi:hypothetical protein